MDYLSRASKPMRLAEGGIKSTDQSFLGKGGGQRKQKQVSLGWKGQEISGNSALHERDKMSNKSSTNPALGKEEKEPSDNILG